MKTTWLVSAMVAAIAGCGTASAQVSQTAAIAGTWIGKYSGEDSGTITIVIGMQGNATCTIDSAAAGQVAVPGTATLLADDPRMLRLLDNVPSVAERKAVLVEARKRRAFILSCPGLQLTAQNASMTGKPPHLRPPNVIYGNFNLADLPAHVDVTGTFSATRSRR